MPVLVCGSEGEWALYQNTLTSVGVDDKRRGSVELLVGDTMFKSIGAATSNDTWWHVRLAGEDQAINTGNILPIDLLLIRDSSSRTIAGLRCVNISGVSFWRHNFLYATNGSGGTTTGSETFDAAENEFHDYDIRIRITTVTDPDDTLTVDFYRDNQLRLSITQTDSGGFNQPDNILLSWKANNTNPRMNYQDVVVTDSIPTVGMELAVLVPSAVGNYSGFDNDYTNIDDNGYDASTVISTTNPVIDRPVRESWIFATPTFTLGDKVIYAVVLDTVAQLDLGGNVTDFRPFLRITATDYVGTDLGANNIAPDSYVTVFETNPATSQPWAEADLAALEAGFLALPDS